jgi:hypothetical protein
MGGSQAALTNDADVNAPPFKPQTPIFQFIRRKFQEGQSMADFAVGQFQFNGPNATVDAFKATIDWGDGTSSSPGFISLVGGTGTTSIFGVTGNHTFAEEGPSTITVTIDQLGGSSAGGETDTFSDSINVDDAPLEAEHATFNAPEGVSMTQVVATLTDLNPAATTSDFTTPSIDWGDGAVTGGSISQPSGPGTPFLVTGTHTYDDSESSGAEMDGFPVVVTITDMGGSVAIATSQANLFDPVLIDPGVNVQAVSGSLFRGNVASFSSSNPRAATAEFTALVNWGDGQSSAGAIVPSASGGFVVLGDHTYSQAGTFTVSTTVRDDEGQSVSDTSIATVAVPFVAQGLPISAAAGKRFAGAVAKFTDPNRATLAGGLSALIDWGDGSQSRGVVVAAGRSKGGATFKVLGSHVYAGHGRFAGSVTIADSGGAHAVVPIVAQTRAGHSATRSSGSNAGRKFNVNMSGVALHASHPKGPRAGLLRQSSVKPV